MPKREIDEAATDEQDLLRDIGNRACALGTAIHPTEIRKALATVHLDDTRLDLRALLEADDATFKGEIAGLHDNLDDETRKLKGGFRPRFVDARPAVPGERT